MKYDVFISYRREGGYDTAKHLNDLLVRDGYKVSFDIDTLRNGNFDTQLLERIEQCKDFILIVDKHAFDRTLDPNFDRNNDWLRCELAHALNHKKNIIPVFLSGVTGFPKGLPDDINGVVKKNGPEYNKYYFDGFYQTLCSRFLTSRSKKKMVFGGLLFLLLIVGGIILLLNGREPKDVVYQNPMIPSTTDEIEFQIYAKERLDLIIDSLRLTNPNIAIKSWSDKKDNESELNVGLCYIVGYGCTKDYKKAIKYISNAANNGVPVAQYLLGVCYDNGFGITQDLESATNWYKLAAEQGVLEAQCDYGIACTTQNNMHEAFKWLSQSAEQGYARAQYTLGWNYGSINNVKEALYWMEKAAEQDFVMAKLQLGNIYVNGPSVFQDFDSAVEIFEDLAKQNNAIAQYNLAVCYSKSIGVDLNYEKALEYVKKSAEQEYAPALVELGGVYCSGLPILDIPQNYNRAMELYHKAAEQGFPMAQIMIGRMYENGWGVQRSIEKSQEWYEKAEKQGYSIQQLQQEYLQQQQQQLQRISSEY